MVVPMLAPITIGIALVKSIDPLATMATIIDVVVELLCKIAVANNPINKLIKGLEVTESIGFTLPLPKCPKEEISRSIENKKIIRISTTENTFPINSNIFLSSDFTL